MDEKNDDAGISKDKECLAWSGRAQVLGDMGEDDK
jgi:hypothetical protein